MSAASGAVASERAAVLNAGRGAARLDAMLMKILVCAAVVAIVMKVEAATGEYKYPKARKADRKRMYTDRARAALSGWLPALNSVPEPAA